MIYIYTPSQVSSLVYFGHFRITIPIKEIRFIGWVLFIHLRARGVLDPQMDTGVPPQRREGCAKKVKKHALMSAKYLKTTPLWVQFFFKNRAFLGAHPRSSKVLKNPPGLERVP